MKKLSILFTVVIIFATIFSSCEKQEFEETNQKNQKVIKFNTFDLTIKNNMLSFASVKNFDNALEYLAKDEQNNFENWNKKSDFNSMAITFKDTKNEMPADDEILTNFLNADGTVEIQGKIFKLDFKKEIVLVYENNEAYKNNKLTKTYTFDDEVLTEEFGTEEEIVELNNSKGAPNWNPNYRTFYNIGNVDVKYKIAYFKYVVYFTLVAKMKKSKIQYNGTCLYVYAEGDYTPRNKLNKNFDDEKESWSPKFKVRPWYSTRSLTNYYIDAYFYTHSGSVSDTDTWAH